MGSLSRKHLRVELDDGRELDLTTTNDDQITYEETRARRKWPQITEGGITTWWTFLAYMAARRTGQVEPTTKWEDWRQMCVDITNLDDEDDDEDAELGDPTRPAVSVNSMSP